VRTYYDGFGLNSKHILFLAAVLFLPGCATIVSTATTGVTDNISQAILNQNDPATVRDGAPSFLLMLDGFIQGDPENIDLLLSGSKLYGSYTSAFLVEDEVRSNKLSTKSLSYARRALCLDLPKVCNAVDGKMDAFISSLDGTDASDIKVLYGFTAAWAGWIQANSSDWNAIASVSKLTALLEHCLLLDETYDGGGAHIYLGVIKSFLPPALGGKPEIGREHFERATEISKGENLMIKVLMAEHYSRTIFDQELHDSLLTSVIEAEVEYPGYTLINSLAQQRAVQLLSESGEFF
jgi:hypothetical protein